MTVLPLHLLWFFLAPILNANTFQTENSVDCKRTYFNCFNGKCIPKYRLCDGKNDCGNYRDEENCPDPCQLHEFTCQNNKCIPYKRICEGICGDGSDEAKCRELSPSTDTKKKPCPSEMHTCQNGNCISNSWICDGDNDCGDGSDEVDCSEKSTTTSSSTTTSTTTTTEEHCPPSYFTCINRLCVRKGWLCDGDNDCGDGSDEEKCDYAGDDGQWTLEKAVDGGKLLIVSYFISERNVGIDTKLGGWERTPLHIASKKGDLNIVKWLVGHDANVGALSNDNDTLKTPIHLAAAFGHLVVVKYLIEEFDANMTFWKDKVGNIPLLLAADGGCLPVVSYFIIDRSVDIETKGEMKRSALHHACQKGHLDVVKWLVEHDAIIFAKDSSWYESTPIELASKHCHLQVIKYFIEELDATFTNTRFAHGDILLHRAADGGCLPVVSYFIAERNVGIETKGFWQRTALHQASVNGHLEVVKWLVEHGANVSARSVDYDHSQTPTHLAAGYGHLPVVKYLIGKFPNQKNLKTRNGRTPLKCAELNGQDEVAEYLRKSR